MFGHDDSLRVGQAKSRFKVRLRCMWIETDKSTCRSEAMTLTPKDRAIFISIVAVLVTAIALVVMVEH